MLVREAMSTAIVTVRAGAPVRTALRLLAEHRVTVLPVVDEAGRIIGIVSEADLVRDHLRPDPRLATDPGQVDHARTAVVSDVMARHTVVVHPETDLVEVGRIVGSTRIKSLPVVDAADQVVGMVSRSDVVRMLARGDDMLQQDIVDALSAAGILRWQVTVRNGAVELTAPEAGATDTARAHRIAEATPGVTAVSVH